MMRPSIVDTWDHAALAWRCVERRTLREALLQRLFALLGAP